MKICIQRVLKLRRVGPLWGSDMRGPGSVRALIEAERAERAERTGTGGTSRNGSERPGAGGKDRNGSERHSGTCFRSGI